MTGRAINTTSGLSSPPSNQMQIVSANPARRVEATENEIRHGWVETLLMKARGTMAATKVSALGGTRRESVGTIGSHDEVGQHEKASSRECQIPQATTSRPEDSLLRLERVSNRFDDVVDPF